MKFAATEYNPPWQNTRWKFTESGFDYNLFSFTWFLWEICVHRMAACSTNNQELQRKVFQLEKCNMWANHLLGNLHTHTGSWILTFYPALSISAPWWNNCVGCRRWSWMDPTNRPRLGPAFWWELKEEILAHERSSHTVIMLWEFKITHIQYITHSIFSGTCHCFLSVQVNVFSPQTSLYQHKTKTDSKHVLGLILNYLSEHVIPKKQKCKKIFFCSWYQFF